jgi:Protein of unknown function (DUF3667)
VSHVAERKEKDCLNCGTNVQGRYCHICGQENVVPHETFWHMVKHFFYDITHFDSKFFDSLKFLILRPGLLSKEYMKGKRNSFLNPVKMYVFTSAVFFLVFFSFISIDESAFTVNKKKEDVIEKFRDEKNAVLKTARTEEDSLSIERFYKVLGPDTLARNRVKSKENSNNVNFSFDTAINKYKTVAEYDSIQRLLPVSKRDGWFIKIISRKTVSLNSKYEGRGETLSVLILQKFIKSFPYILFVSLPLYAFFLKLIYFRNKKLYFADHGIFLVHTYIFTFILMLLFIGLSELSDLRGFGWLGWLQGALIIYGIWYVFRAMRNFYGQGFGKTFLKFILFNILCLISINLLFVIFLLATFFQV